MSDELNLTEVANSIYGDIPLDERYAPKPWQEGIEGLPDEAQPEGGNRLPGQIQDQD